MKIEHEEEILEKHIGHYIQKNKYDRLAFMKGVASANKWNFIKFGVIRCCLQIDDYIIPFVTAWTLEWLQKTEEESFQDTMTMVALGLSIPIIQMIVHTIWEFFCFQMIEVGHRTHTALKTMLFRKNLKMTGATNKDFSSGEINGIIMHDSNMIWTFIWEGPAYLECAIHLTSASYIIYQEIGYCGLIVLLFIAIQFALQKVRAKTEKDIGEKKREKSETRTRYINEAFSNIKTVKLFGWEGDFIKKVDEVYNEELKLEDIVMLRAKAYDFFFSCLHQFFPIAVFGLYQALGNTLTLSKMALVTIMLNRVKGRLNHTTHLYNLYFSTMERMEKLWQFYTAPETQKGLISKTFDHDAVENTVTIKGNFSWGVTPKLDQADKDKIKEKLKKKDYEKKTKGMNKVRKAIFDMMPEKKVHYQIPLKDRTMNQIINLKDIDISVKKGSFTVIIGETGSGKTSLLNAMIGELIHLPDQAVKEIGALDRPIKDGELRYLEDALLSTDLTKSSPISLHGTTGFCEQQAWIQNGKLRDNVLFGGEFNQRQYVETIMACQLEPDLAIMPAGDMSEIGEKGINLSGGQKARLALARAIYKRPDILIMDDPISALDAHVRKAIFDQVFTGLMKDKTRILVTHAVDFVHLADHIIIMKDGKIEAQGSYNYLQGHPYMLEIMDIHTKNKKEIEDQINIDSMFQTPILGKAKTDIHFPKKVNNDEVDNESEVISSYSSLALDEPNLARFQSHQLFVAKAPPKSSKGSEAPAKKDDADDQLLLGKSKPINEESAESAAKKPEETPEAEKSDESLVKVELTQEELDAKIVVFRGLNNELDAKTSSIVGKLLQDEADEKVNPDMSTVWKLYSIAGGFSSIVFLVGVAMFSRYWDMAIERFNAEHAMADPETQSDAFYSHLKTMGYMTCIGILVNQVKNYLENQKFRYIANGILNSTLTTVLQAPVNLFFDITPVGKILGIFQREINTFRTHLFMPIMHCMGMFTHIFFVLHMLMTYGSYEVYAVLAVMVMIMNYVIWPYLSADNQLHKVGSTLWGPIHSYFYECMRGTSIIRAFGQEETIMEKQHMLLNKTTTHFIAHHSCWCWFNLRMFYTTKLFQLMTMIVLAKARTTADTVSLVLLFNMSQDMGWFMHFFGCINWFMRNINEAQRVFNLQEAPQEKIKADKPVELPENWPAQGAIEFKDVDLRYRPNTDLVLKKVSFRAEPGMKVGVVGRTGAGKSTLCMALTRIVELEQAKDDEPQGKIEIDGVDVSKLDIAALRKQITMIPQDPCLFTGSLRFNLDPFDQHTDERIMELIKKAGLEYLLEGESKQDLEDKKKKEEEDAKKKAEQAFIDSDDEDKKDEDKEEKKDEDKKDEDDDKKKDDDDEEDGKGLKFKVQEEGKNLSVGERQLICIIRAVLRCNKVVILDEATANIDVVTEQAIQKLINEEFAGATVLTIAHRLNTIIKSDRVLMLQRGAVLEYGSPKELMADPNSSFAKLAEEKRKKEAKGESTAD